MSIFKWFLFLLFASFLFNGLTFATQGTSQFQNEQDPNINFHAGAIPSRVYYIFYNFLQSQSNLFVLFNLN